MLLRVTSRYDSVVVDVSVTHKQIPRQICVQSIAAVATWKASSASAYSTNRAVNQIGFELWWFLNLLSWTLLANLSPH